MNKKTYASADLIPYLRDVEGIKHVDMIEVIGDNGIHGYIRQSELGCDVVSQASLEYFLRTQTENRSVNVYDPNTGEVLDAFTVGKDH